MILWFFLPPLRRHRPRCSSAIVLVRHGDRGVPADRAGSWAAWYDTPARELPALHRPDRSSRSAIGGAGPDHPDRHRQPGGQRRGPAPEALHAARARRPRHLRQRGLLQLPLADDPHAGPRRAALRRATTPPRRVDLRPPVPVGLEAHRPGPGPRGRETPRDAWHFTHMHRPALDLAGLEHAALPVALREEDRLQIAAQEDRRPAQARRALPGR